ncbi:uncharacterized protein TRIVIDRAFT_219580 [Trichoderma virens Gv29-8]|uniref:Uncharacterized protein n=1 Tax=Hypocrea virens (strain Gv29-8 / FGSC 10586) TaxID=413071 RepID=G9MK13_HYPVG|nr:uncharacterized protein TRIVIDRAFT_219580 [Trichoderma virens Gv29-8]EHK25818.1 hypothetical protein TRIVIDRAFT_219580 [Trichoderma virens Gv29-8]UKZ48358.1 hypothetical protein TrVGV298_002581 [Trichoderma virens]
MKTFQAALLLMVSIASAVQPNNLATRSMHAQQLCGSLEVMKMDINQIPDGISLDNVRMLTNWHLLSILGQGGLVIMLPLMAAPGDTAGSPVMLTASGVGLPPMVDTVLGQRVRLLKTAVKMMRLLVAGSAANVAAAAADWTHCIGSRIRPFIDDCFQGIFKK